jgi:DNA gyrase/topoisomerase IV subunit A
MADNIRSIPSVADGLKPGQRKVLFGCFKRNLTPDSDIKVAQLAGYVSEKTAYHHGEQSLTATIVGLAQTFVGSNNINLLSPNGQFGTRIAVSAIMNIRFITCMLILYSGRERCGQRSLYLHRGSEDDKSDFPSRR